MKRKKTKKMKKLVWPGIVISLVVFFIILAYLIYRLFLPAKIDKTFVEPQPAIPSACPLDGKICPDGSSVGRMGVNCEFGPCPEAAKPIPVDWISSHNDQGITFRHPSKMPTKYISSQTWPPKISVSTTTPDAVLDCPTAASTDSRQDWAAKRTIITRTYCIKATSEGAAGSVYTDYTYTTLNASRLVTVSFTLRSPQCLNYDNPKQAECAQERTKFDLDSLVDQIVGTIK